MLRTNYYKTRNLSDEANAESICFWGNRHNALSENRLDTIVSEISRILKLFMFSLIAVSRWRPLFANFFNSPFLIPTVLICHPFFLCVSPWALTPVLQYMLLVPAMEKKGKKNTGLLFDLAQLFSSSVQSLFHCILKLSCSSLFFLLFLLVSHLWSRCFLHSEHPWKPFHLFHHYKSALYHPQTIFCCFVSNFRFPSMPKLLLFKPWVSLIRHESTT